MGKKRCLVTGGAGFIGSHLVETLLKEGHQIRVLDNFETGNRATVSTWGNETETIEASIEDANAVEKAVDGMDWVFHQAARGSVPRSIEDPMGTHTVNITGTLNVLAACRRANVERVVCASSSAIYGDTLELPKHEEMLPSPESPYAVSKVTLEHYCRVFFRAYGLQTVSLRYFNVFGPRQNPLLQYAAVIPIFIRNMLQQKSSVIYGDGEQTRDFVYVEDCARANLLAATSNAASGNVYNVASGIQISVNQLFRTLQELTGSDIEPVYESVRPGDVRHSCGSVSRAELDLTFQPKFTLQESLKLTTDWYKSSTQQQ